MKLEELSNKLIAVLGYGMEGKAVIRFLKQHGFKFTLFDQRSFEQFTEEEQLELKSIGMPFVLGKDAFSELSGIDIAFRSPGVSFFNNPILKTYLDKGLVFTSQTKFFLENSPAKIIGVTGTKGKGTTSTLIYQILKKSLPGKNIFLTGNIGETQALDIFNKLSENDFVVFELSSFQLEDLQVSPHIGVVLMVTSEHLDYHGNLENYISAKEPIVKFQKLDDYAVVNSDYQFSKKIGQTSQGKKIFFSRFSELPEGVFVRNNFLMYKNDVLEENIFNLSELTLKGRHNYENVCAAVSVAKLLDIANSSILKVLKEFKGLKHRLEYFDEIKGVKFYDDSFSTTPETTIAAIESFSEKITLVLGGSDKKSNFVNLAKCVNKATNLKNIILIGQQAEKIKNAIVSEGGFSGKIIEGLKTMHEIVQQAYENAEAGEVILLSPACASFDMFKNYKDRGEQFKNEVSLLKQNEEK